MGSRVGVVGVALLTVVLAWQVWASAAGPFAVVDQRALKAPVSVEQSVESLARYLAPAHYSETEKARSIFRWVSDRVRYDVAGLRANRLGDQSAAAVLKQRKGVCEGYSRLYMALAQSAGLQVQYIQGRSQFEGMLPFKLPAGVSGHGWNAVLLDGRWRLLDVTWAAGSVDKGGNYKHAFNDFWFCPPPEQFVYSHFPRQERWQLIDSPWNAQKFDRSPKLSSVFFRYGLSWPNSPEMPLQTRGEQQLTWGAPAGVVTISSLSDAQGKPLPNYTFSQSIKGKLVTRVRCPRPGRYTLSVFCRPRSNAWEADTSRPDSYDGVATLPIQSSGSISAPFPATFGSYQRAGAELVEPWEGRLSGGRPQRFRLRVPGASEVAVYVDDRQTARLPIQNGLAQGTLTLPPRGKLQVCARFPQENRYWGMLEYQIR